MFYDGNPASADPEYAFAYDLDFEERPQDRLKVAFSFEEMRAFFLLGVPRLQEGDFGLFYDVGDFNAYDAAPFNAFADGYPYVTAARYRQLWHSVNEIRAGGVGFDLYLED